MNYEKGKAPLALMEQIVMILVFAIAAAVCMQAFVYANNLSDTANKRDQAMAATQEIAECVKACGGDLSMAGTKIIATDEKQITVTDNSIKVEYNIEEPMTVTLSFLDGDKYIQRARIVASVEKENILSTDIAWQRGGRL